MAQEKIPNIAGCHTLWERELSLHHTGVWQFAAALPYSTCREMESNLSDCDTTREFLVLPPDERPV